MSVIVSGNEVVLNGCVGDPSGWGWEDCFTASDVILALARVGQSKDVVIRINSGGGIATEGSAIHSAIARHGGKKTIIVEGIAASAASVIAMAGDEVVMSLGALLMIHDPSGFTMGTITDHEMQISALTALGDAMATIYAAKSGQDAAVCRADMKAETWMTADQAVAKGYADRADTGAAAEPEDDDVEVIDPAPFNYTLYANAPKRMVALSKAKKWTAKQPATSPPEPEPAVASQGASQDMTEDELKQKLAAARAEGLAEGEAKTAVKVGEATASTMPRSQASEIAELCQAGGVATMAASLLAEGVSVDQAKTRIAQAGEIKEMVALARKTAPAIAATAADEFIAAGKTIDQARAALFDQMVAKTEAETKPLATYHRAGAGGSDNAGNANAREQMKSNMKATLEKQGLVSPKKEG